LERRRRPYTKEERRASDLRPIGQILAELGWLDDLRIEAEQQVEPIVGPIQPWQRPWSDALDQIELERQRVAEQIV
jgi:hypothetical protein